MSEKSAGRIGVAQKRRGSAKNRAETKRRQQRKKLRRRIAVSILGFLGLSTLLGFAFLLGGGAQKKSVAAERKVQTRGGGHSAGANVRQEKIEVAEEYPAEERSVGFGLEDLIHKTRRKEKRTSDPVQTAADPAVKPRLVLIIDDVSRASQLEAIRSLPYRITPSIFPPSEMARRSHLLARGLKHYMIHLPLESGSRKMNRFTGTLFVDDGPRKIRERVRQIRRLFPDARFVNNHTGSVFTSNYGAMSHLYGDLLREGFRFVDSRTSGRSVVRKVAADYRQPYLGRDIFIDNVRKRSAILAQLKKAVRIARRRGYAIAIGHPHRATFDALRHARKVLAPVETVYIDEWYRSRYGK